MAGSKREGGRERQERGKGRRGGRGRGQGQERGRSRKSYCNARDTVVEESETRAEGWMSGKAVIFKLGVNGWENASSLRKGNILV